MTSTPIHASPPLSHRSGSTLIGTPSKSKERKGCQDPLSKGDLEDDIFSSLPPDLQSGHKPWVCGEPLSFPFPTTSDNPLGAIYDRMKKYDKNMCDAWRDEIEKLLIFAGLFSATVTAFLVQSYRWLQEDHTETTALLLAHISLQLNNLVANTNATSPPMMAHSPFVPTEQSIRINVFWFLSLVLCLSAVVLGILCCQWLREYSSDFDLSTEHAITNRQMHMEGLFKWKVPEIISSLPVMLQLSVLLFFAGILDLLWSLHHVVAATITIIMGLTSIIVIFTTVAPVVQILYERSPSIYQCPYKSPQSFLVFKLVNRCARLFYDLLIVRFRIIKHDPTSHELFFTHERIASWSDFDGMWRWFRYFRSKLRGDGPDRNDGIDIDCLTQAFLWTLTTLSSSHNLEVFQDIFHCLHSTLERSISRYILGKLCNRLRITRDAVQYIDNLPLKDELLLIELLMVYSPGEGSQNLLCELEVRCANTSLSAVPFQKLDKQSRDHLRALAYPRDNMQQLEVILQKFMAMVLQKNQDRWFSQVWMTNLIEIATTAPLTEDNLILHRDIQRLAISLIGHTEREIDEAIKDSDAAIIANKQRTFSRIIEQPRVGPSGLRKLELWEKNMECLDGRSLKPWCPVTHKIISFVVRFLVRKSLVYGHPSVTPSLSPSSRAHIASVIDQALDLEDRLKRQGYWPVGEKSSTLSSYLNPDSIE
ncbi:hypothetical protein AMATHDRAFT_87764 [Amanita thiersii Skay4041]|uniref:DUF6535 domain-containing protein n=1 Tax=Amanita thiersii Skay4041 TaxID=703135 RepID=A0A2A9NGI5_9AGAR|nr:hypothetical protein AMATHDRAFT_87764 [Amanita thiersii Skay4041]